MTLQFLPPIRRGIVAICEYRQGCRFAPTSAPSLRVYGRDYFCRRLNLVHVSGSRHYCVVVTISLSEASISCDFTCVVTSL